MKLIDPCIQVRNESSPVQSKHGKDRKPRHPNDPAWMVVGGCGEKGE